VNETELEQKILATLRDREAGIDELARLLAHFVSKRTLQRRLEQLFATGKVQRTGKARATRYRAIIAPNRANFSYIATNPIEETSIVQDSTETYSVPETQIGPQFRPEPGPSLEEDSKLIRNYLRDHYSLRKPCGYRREFLDSYTPNKTYYLGETLREHLREISQSKEMADLPPGTYARQVLSRLIIDLSWNSGRLEGSTYSLLETDFLLAQGKSEDPTRAQEAQMLLNHKYAIEFLVDEPEQLGFNRYTILNLHAVLADGLLKNHQSEGALRHTPVGISGTVYHPTNNPALIEECFDIILKKASAIKDPIECSFFVMVHMPYLQPFEDANKRMSRLTANLPLIQGNLTPLSFVDVSVKDYTDGILGVYELNQVDLLRDVFAWAFERSAGRYASIRQEIGEPDPIQMRYRREIHDRVRDVVVQKMDKPTAARAIKRWSDLNITASDRAKFVETVEERLLALTAVNGVRYRLRPSEFQDWWPIWKG
jgi:hypothetical protein